MIVQNILWEVFPEDLNEKGEIIIPDDINFIWHNAFHKVKNIMKSIVLPNSLIRINDYCFNGCKALETVIIKSKDLIIGKCAFQDCISLTDINLENVIEIKDFAFRGCVNLKKATYSKNIKKLAKNAFESTSVYDDKIKLSSLYGRIKNNENN